MICLPDLVQPAGRETVRKLIQDGINRLGTFAIPFGILTKDRSPADGILIGRGIFTNPMNITGIEGYILKMQAQVSGSTGHGGTLPDDLWQRLLEHTGDVIVYVAGDGTIRYITPSVSRIFGYRPEQIVMTSFSLLLVHEEAERFDELREKVHHMGSGGSSTRFMAKSGSGAVIPILIRLFPSHDSEGNVILAITQVQEEKSLVSPSDDLFRAACAASPVPLIITGRQDRRIIRVNEAFLNLSGKGDSDEVAGLTLSGVGLQATPDEISSIESVLDTSGGYEGEVTEIRTPLGTVQVLLSARSFPTPDQQAVTWSLVPIPSGGGKGQSTDLDPEMIKTLNLRYKSNLQLLEGVMSTKGLHADIPSSRVIREMRVFLFALSGYYSRISGTSGSDQVPICPYLSAVQANVSDMYEDLLEQVTINIRCEGDWSLSSARGVPIGIITTELLINSITHAFSPGETGRIDISFTREEDWYILEIRDSGKGLPEEMTHGQPTGAGLALVEDLAMQISGTASFSNDGGARIRIIFPDQ
jgi:PAS domain S-box-containing protein